MATNNGTTIINIGGKPVTYGFYYLDPSYDDIPPNAGVQRRAIRWPESPPNVPLIYRKRPTVNHPQPGPNPDVLGDCYKLKDHGYDMSSTPMMWKQEAINFMANPEIELISALNDQGAALLRQVYNDRYQTDLKIICTGAYIKDFDCFIENIKYDSVPEYDVFIAKYYFPGGIPSIDKFGNPVSLAVPRSPDGYYYVTAQGQLCFFDQAIPESNVPIPPAPPVIEDPEAPLVGAGQVYSNVNEIHNDVEIVTLPLWHKNKESNVLTRIIDAAIDDNYESIDYMLEVLDGTESECPEVLYKLIYADYEGKGTIDTSGNDSITMTKAMYTQYANVLLPTTQAKFKFDSLEDNAVFIIDVMRKCYHDKIDTRVFELTLNDVEDGLNPAIADPGDMVISAYAIATNGILTVIPHEDDLNKKEVRLLEGTLEVGVTGVDTIGLLYPEHGIIVLSTARLEASGLSPIVTKESAWSNETNTRRAFDISSKQPYRLYQMITVEDDGVLDSSGDPRGFIGRAVQKKYVKYAHIRIKNQHYNFSNNPTYVVDTITGNIIDSFIENSQTYITSIGLYNDKKELLAVAKMSNPILKNASEEAIITVKIEQ